ncbi:TIGR03087 family PEP-CTERM/XrtA system glycosyltransferase [Catenovulum sp. 2E275]|uniref:TIGR03087 family PEP-CTERM/XrtA system glycosyltransferase n=1 Tax=Catenovulum sp. 2E275 TaxID=2980497 RepID=UPI0021D1F31F|nr:TIGR03087 family PEP-CTERM/XrtA system glycosyltransferase [Catenovulum sp. 2E275]MCU4675536.1 TIGR03087 family PEP-CTERM/XrtA system glycosyltransferase [Catenovulum sp. 2E275]
MEKLLFLSHVFPAPPNKGNKIRAFNLIKFLSQYFEIHLGCFSDRDLTEDDLNQLKPYIAQLYYVPIKHRTTHLLTSFSLSLLTNKTITYAYFSNTKLQTWVDSQVKQYKFNTCYVFCTSMAQYATKGISTRAYQINLLLDLVDVDSSKWLLFSNKAQFIKKWIYQREAKKLASYEKALVKQFNTCLLVSQQEAHELTQMAPNYGNKIHFIENGVDTVFFSQKPTISLQLKVPYIVFTGAMDYWANVDAMLWFIKNVWSDLLEILPELKLFIVGSNPHKALRNYHGKNNIYITGYVQDIRPYLKNSLFAIAPLQISRGIQNKVLEAMASGKPIILSPSAANGLNLNQEQLSLICQTKEDYLTQIQTLYNNHFLIERISKANQNWIKSNYSWEQCLNKLFHNKIIKISKD